MTDRPRLVAALDQALEQRVMKLFEVLCSELGSEEAFDRFAHGVRMTVAIYNRAIDRFVAEGD